MSVDDRWCQQRCCSVFFLDYKRQGHCIHAYIIYMFRLNYTAFSCFWPVQRAHVHSFLHQRSLRISGQWQQQLALCKASIPSTILLQHAIVNSGGSEQMNAGDREGKDQKVMSYRRQLPAGVIISSISRVSL